MKYHRLARFGGVGIVATMVHGCVLLLLKATFHVNTGIANLAGFLMAFGVSMYGQQRFSFQDRLQGKRLNSLGLAILFVVNLGSAWFLGTISRGGWLVLLPLVPAAINYALLYALTGNKLFKR